MVVLRPLFEGEIIKRCSGCTHVGLCSPYPERSSYFPHRSNDRRPGRYASRCFLCARRRNRSYHSDPEKRDAINERQRLNYARRTAALSREKREKVRSEWRERKARRLLKDLKGERKRRRDSDARHREKRRQMTPEALLEQRENRRIDQKVRAERAGKSRLKTKAEVQRHHGISGISYPAETLRAFLWSLLRDAERAKRGPGSSVAMAFVPSGETQRVVATSLAIPTRTLYRWMNEVDEIDEMTLDRIATAHGGIMWWEIVETFSGVRAPKLREAEEMAKAPSTSCGDPGCTEPVVEGRFCPPHAERLARVRDELKADGRKMSSNGGSPRARCGERKAKKARPTCTRAGCWEPRHPGDDFCDVCRSMGYEREVEE